jgi:hypothetical protein
MSTKSAGPMCCVTVRYLTYLLPQDKAMKLVALLSEAIEVEQRYDERLPNGDATYALGESPQVELVSVKASQIRAPKAPAPQQKPRQARIGQEALKLPFVERQS